MEAMPAQRTTSPALSAAVNTVTDRDLQLRVDILVARSVGALAACRAVDFVGFENREMSEPSLALWNEVAPVFSNIFKELHSLMDAALELFPKEGAGPGGMDVQEAQDLDAAFGALESGAVVHASAPRPGATAAQRVTELVQSYAWAIKQSVQDEIHKLREPSLMMAQWNLLGELEEFRDRSVGALQGMVCAVLSVFDDVELEALFPAANEMVELGVALRHELSDLTRVLADLLATAKQVGGPDQTRELLAKAEERVGRVLQLPSLRYVRAVDRRELVTFVARSNAMRSEAQPSRLAAAQLLDALSTFLASLSAVDLKARLRDHDREVCEEALNSLRRAGEAVHEKHAHALLFLAHAMRRIARLRGISPELDAAHTELAALSQQGSSPAQLKPVLQRLWHALQPLATSL